MIPKDLGKIQQALKAIHTVNKVREALKAVDDVRKAREMILWLKKNREIIRHLSPGELEHLREKAEYDKDAWEEIVRELKS